MAIEQSKRMQQVVKVAQARKQRLAGAAMEARRKLVAADEERALAAERMHAAQSALRDAADALSQNGASDQALVWRSHCLAQQDQRIADKAQSEDICAEAEGELSKSLQALHRQDLRHDHLSGQAHQLRQQLARLQEARLESEAQGSSQQGGAAII